MEIDKAVVRERAKEIISLAESLEGDELDRDRVIELMSLVDMLVDDLLEMRGLSGGSYIARRNSLFKGRYSSLLDNYMALMYATMECVLSSPNEPCYRGIPEIARRIAEEVIESLDELGR